MIHDQPSVVLRDLPESLRYDRLLRSFEFYVILTVSRKESDAGHIERSHKNACSFFLNHL